jgi:hypothetical protein
MKEQNKKMIMRSKILFIETIMVILIASISDDSPNTIKPISDNLLHLSYSQQETMEQKIVNSESAQTNASVGGNKTVQGTLIVTTKVNNEGGGSSKPSDFTIKVHGNNPSPSSFPGNSSGTAVKLNMGMYSVIESGPPNYNSSSSMDCSGAVMSIETIICEITNTYIKPIN